MTPSPTPTPIEVVLQSHPAHWWEVLGALGPLAVLLGAVLAAILGWSTLKQKREADAKALEQKLRADDRSEWWRRAQWALDRAIDADADTKALGLVTLEVLARSELARTEELELFNLAWEAVTDPRNGTKAGMPGTLPAAECASEPLLRGKPFQDLARSVREACARRTRRRALDVNDNGSDN